MASVTRVNGIPPVIAGNTVSTSQIAVICTFGCDEILFKSLQPWPSDPITAWFSLPFGEADEIKFGKTKGALAKADVVFRNFLRDRLILDII